MTDKFIFRFVAGISVFVFLVVIILNRHLIPAPAIVPSFVQYLPKLNATLNGTCSILLLVSLYFIKNGNIPVHKRINILTFCLSSLFLVSYILFHYLKPETLFGDLNGDGRLSDAEKASAGTIRYVYYVILTSHIILAAGVVPMILFSFYRGLQMQLAKPQQLVRLSFSIWL